MSFCSKRGGKYSKEDLVNLAVKSGLTKSKALQSSKQELCDYLKITEDSPVRKTSKKNSEKVCINRRSREFPNRYKREDLIDIIMDKYHNISPYELKAAKYDDLCKLAKIPTKSKSIDKKEKDKKQKEKKDKPKSIPKSFEIPKNRKNCLLRGTKKLKSHQLLVNEQFKETRGLILVHSVGSGKTLTAVAALNCYLDERPDKHRVIVVTPKSLQGNFKDELLAYDPELDKDPRIEITTYQTFYRRYKKELEEYKEWENSDQDGTFFKKLNYALIIFDEAHNLRNIENTNKNGKPSMNKVIMEVSYFANKVLLLTATPLVNNDKDLMSLVNIVKGDNVFKDDHQKDIAKFKKIVKNDDMFKEYFGCTTSFFDPDEKQRERDYPRLNILEKYIPMSEVYYKRYMEVENNAVNSTNLPKEVAKFYKFREDNLAFYSGLRIATNNLEGYDSAKFQYIIKKIRKFPTKKFLVFTQFISSSIHMLEKLFKQYGITYVKVDGSMSKSTREEAVRLYNSDVKNGEVIEPKVQVILISKSGAEGLSLMRTRYVILMEPTWSENILNQIIGRAVRYKSHELLPAKDRVVDAINLYHLKPEEYEKLDKEEGFDQDSLEELNGMPSVDLLLKFMAEEKEFNNDEFMDRLKGVSIENMDCFN
jgi:SNF2 family DNA or RNA helicase